VDTDNVVVFDPSRRPRLANEPSPSAIVRQFGPEYLQGHMSLQGVIESEEDDSHPSAAEFLEDGVTAEHAVVPRRAQEREPGARADVLTPGAEAIDQKPLALTRVKTRVRIPRLVRPAPKLRVVREDVESVLA
jgi:hypothetical protein